MSCGPIGLQSGIRKTHFRRSPANSKSAPSSPPAVSSTWDLIERDTFFDFYDKNKEQGKSPATTSSGGNFWNTQKWRIGPRFASAVVRAAREGRLLDREAYSLTGLKRNTFEMLRQLGVRFELASSS